ncbi:type VI secretion system tube protein Hcp [Haloferula helveola]
MKTSRHPARFSSSLALATPLATLTLGSADAYPLTGYLKIPDIDGESNRDKDHVGWIDIESFSMGISRPIQFGPTGPAPTGEAQQQALEISKPLDKSSPQLFLKCATGQYLPTVTLHLTKDAAPGTPTYYVVILSNVIISSLGTSDATTSGSAQPTEQVSFNYTKIDIQYTEVDTATGATGDTTAASYDFSTPTK